MDWQQRYDVGDTPWDLRGITPPLAALLAGGALRALGLPDSADVAVPGCGRGHDLRAFVAHGHRVIGFDIAPGVVDEARRLLAFNRVEGAQVLCRDILGIGPEFERRFDLVYDYTCFCALPTHLRERHAHETATILRDGGLYLALAYPLRKFGGRPEGAGPPFVVTREDLLRAFGVEFALVAEFEAQDSVPQRAGLERWFVFRRAARG